MKENLAAERTGVVRKGGEIVEGAIYIKKFSGKQPGPELQSGTGFHLKAVHSK